MVISRSSAVRGLLVVMGVASVWIVSSAFHVSLPQKNSFHQRWCRDDDGDAAIPSVGGVWRYPTTNSAAGNALVGKQKVKVGMGFCSHVGRMRYSRRQVVTVLASSFYEDFEDFGKQDDDDDEEENDDDEYEELKDSDVANFRARMGKLFGTKERGGSELAEEEDDVMEDEEYDEEDDDEEYIPEKKGIGGSTIGSVDDLISFATTQAKDDTPSSPSTEWATPSPISGGLVQQKGVVLLANPAKFCNDIDDNTNKSQPPSPALLAKFGLTLPPPADLGPDRRADLLPVLVLLDRHPLRGAQAVLMNRRTGYLLGDLEQQLTQSDDDNEQPPTTPAAPRLGAFMIQPLWFGGTSAGGGGSDSGGGSDGGGGGGGGLDMLHQCPSVPGSTKLTDDGLYWGGDPVKAQDILNEPGSSTEDGRALTGFDFKFFVQSTRWLPMQLEKEIRDGTWFVASVSKEVLFKSRDRLGTRRAKPLWTEIMELMGGEFKDVRDQLYEAPLE